MRIDDNDLDASASYPEPYDVTAMSAEQVLQHVRTVVEVLASSAEAQTLWLGTHGFPPDELMLHLADAMDVLVPGHGAGARVSDMARYELRTLLRLLNDIEENHRMWSLAALFIAPEWDLVRAQAGRALGYLPMPNLQPGTGRISTASAGVSDE